MPLIVRKLGYSRSPWRILLERQDGTSIAIEGAWFARRQDAVAYQKRLEALGSWEQAMDDWSAEQLDALQEVARDLPMNVELRALTARNVDERWRGGRP